MEKRKKKEHDFSVRAFRVVQEATGQIEPKSKRTFDAKALGRLGGLKGGRARAASLTPEQRKNVAKKAAWARWDKHSPYDEIKATQLATLLLELSDGEIDYLKFNKLLYNIEREAINRWMRPVIFDDLFSMPHGQVVSKTLDRTKLENQGVESFWRDHIITSNQNNVRLVKKCGNDKLSRAEISLIKEIFDRYKNKTAIDMRNEHHTPELFPEWRDPGQSSKKTTYSQLLRLLGKTQQEIEEFEEDMNELARLKAITR